MRALEYRRRKFVNPNVENHARLRFPYMSHARMTDHIGLAWFGWSRWSSVRVCLLQCGAAGREQQAAHELDEDEEKETGDAGHTVW